MRFYIDQFVEIFFAFLFVYLIIAYTIDKINEHKMRKENKEKETDSKEMWDNAIISRDWFKQLMDSDEDYVDLKKKSKQKKK